MLLHHFSDSCKRSSIGSPRGASAAADHRLKHKDYSLVLIVRLNHYPYRCSISAFFLSAEHISNQHSDSFPGCGKLLFKSAVSLASFLSLRLPISISLYNRNNIIRVSNLRCAISVSLSMHKITGSLLAFGEELCFWNMMLRKINSNVTSVRARAEGMNVILKAAA